MPVYVRTYLHKYEHRYACLNDYGSDDIFKRVFSGLSSEGDILLAITTSGNSRNVIETLKLANARDIFALGFLGNGGGEVLESKVLNRIIRSTEDGYELEADQRHVELIAELMGLNIKEDKGPFG